MSIDTFRITFHGEVMQGYETDEVKANMLRLFKLDINNPHHIEKMDKLFSGRKVIIKAGLSEKVARTYIDAIARAGGEARIDPNPYSLPPSGIDERRNTHRRKQRDRRRSPRLSSILPDRRITSERRFCLAA